MFQSDARVTSAWCASSGDCRFPQEIFIANKEISLSISKITPFSKSLVALSLIACALEGLSIMGLKFDHSGLG